MAREIAEQPAALRATIDALLPRRAEAARLASADPRGPVHRPGHLRQRRRLRQLPDPGLRGPAGHAGRAVHRHHLPGRLDLSGVLAVAMSQSGRTEEIVETLAWARDCGAATMAVTNGAGLAAGRRRPTWRS